MVMLLEVGDVARRSGLSTLRIRQLADAGQLQPAAKTARGLRLFANEEVERFLAVRASARLREPEQ